VSEEADDTPIVIAYDGSENAKHAIFVAGALLGGGSARVVHAWEPVTSASGRLAVYAYVADGAEEAAYEMEQAQAMAEQGAALARKAGFEASGTAIRGLGPTWETLCDYVNEQRPSVVVMGTRGLSGVRGLLSGSVSHGVAAHSHVPVLIVPPEN
jgi:nucleotide-binding universal stress UspA family protein